MATSGSDFFYPTGDVNRDCATNIVDLSSVATYFGQNVNPANHGSDLNSDRIIDIIDLATVGSTFGRGCV